MRLCEKIQKNILPALGKDKGTSIMALPHLDKIIVTVGIGPYREQKDVIEIIKKELSAVTGQIPKFSCAKKSISGFKLREGQTVGFVVTLRGQKMWDFVEKIIMVVLPRMRDFDGIKITSFDKNNNLTFSIREQLMFPEIKADDVKNIWGMGITLSIKNASDKDLTIEYLKQIGFIFK
ncbi:MAG: 50S ribosomal protein L5 [Candidatus Berkelbacteria bacterium]|nr:50S ribosomal protein L5 [Candidatus Berkelbacteria bacterium]